MLSQNPTRVELIQKGRQICRDGSQPPNRNPEAIPAWPLFFLVSCRNSVPQAEHLLDADLTRGHYECREILNFCSAY